jgi:hypothetical protein
MIDKFDGYIGKSAVQDNYFFLKIQLYNSQNETEFLVYEFPNFNDTQI